MTWDEHYRLWKEALDKPGQEAHLRMQAARKRVSKNSQDDWLWLKESLSDPERKGFVAWVFKFQPVPKRLVPSMLLAGVLTKNLIFNRWFIEPCVRSFGSRRVLEELLRYFDSGTNVEKAGAASAFYWVGGNPRNEELDDVILSIRCRMLREFVDNADLQVRRRIIPMLTLKSKDYPEEYRSLVPIAVDIARSHPDEYIRHRVESGWSWRIRPRKNKRSKRTAIE